MFEVGFSELCMVALVALLVIGPERLPKVARLAGYWVGKTRHMMASVKAEISAELQAEELRQLLKEQSGLEELQALQEEVASASDVFKTTVEQPLVESIQQVNHNEPE